jgi:hypothetical protein
LHVQFDDEIKPKFVIDEKSHELALLSDFFKSWKLDFHKQQKLLQEQRVTTTTKKKEDKVSTNIVLK